MNWKQFLNGKRVTLMGLGLLGRGVGDTAFLAQCGADLIVTDKKTKQELASSLAKLKKFKNIQYTLGEHKLEDFRDRDFILKAAGVPLDSLFIAEARKHKIPVHMSTALFAKFACEAGATIVGVTGTRGKSTVTHLIYHTLKKVGRQAHLGGNVQGISTLALLPKIKKGDVCILELDSWQLQGFGELQMSPDVAVFTNLQDDHLNYYRGDREVYFADKANIFRFQKEGDALITGEGVNRLIKRAQPPISPFVPVPLPKEVKLHILGEHNRENAGLAAAALCAIFKMTPDVAGLKHRVSDVIKKGLQSFQPVAGRLQYLRTIRGVKIYNDNNATTPDATIAALRALSPPSSPTSSCQDNPTLLLPPPGGGMGRGGKRKNIVLICGGTDKGLDMSKLSAEIPKHCKAVILLKESGTEKLKKELTDFTEKETLKECVDEAMNLAQRGDIILFSPALASFGKWFKNEYDRGEQFVQLIEKL